MSSHAIVPMKSEVCKFGIGCDLIVGRHSNKKALESIG